jgi:predicted negative regulator of RcsB-dependent stress response
MTSPNTSKLSAEDRAQTFIDWTRLNSKALVIGFLIVLVAAAGFWFNQQQQRLRANAAERALLTAKQSMAAGNLQLAQSDLQKVFSKYGKTPAGIEAAMLLSQIDYDQGKFQDGITRLQKIAGSSAAGTNQSAILSLMGDGYSQMGKGAEAAKAYERAAEATSFENERSFQLAKAARAYQTAGDTAKAHAAWTALLNDPKAEAVAAEARVRIGELTARPAK